MSTTRHTRRTVTIVESDCTTTAFNEAGAAMPDHEWVDVRAALDALLDTGDVRVLVLSGVAAELAAAATVEPIPCSRVHDTP